MTSNLMREAHRTYDLEGDYLRKVLDKDPTISGLQQRLQAIEYRVAKQLPPDQAQALQEARHFLLDAIREAAFKMGFVMARNNHNHDGDEG